MSRDDDVSAVLILVPNFCKDTAFFKSFYLAHRQKGEKETTIIYNLLDTAQDNIQGTAKKISNIDRPVACYLREADYALSR